MLIEVYLKGDFMEQVTVPENASQKEVSLILYDLYGDDWDYYLHT